MFTDIYVRAADPIDLATRSRAAYLLFDGRCVLAGWSAAELLGSSCGPADAPAKVLARGGRRRSRKGLLVHGDTLAADETLSVEDVRLTSPLRTAYDLARWKSLTDAVIAVDALAHTFRFAPDDLLSYPYAQFGSRGSAKLPAVVRLADPLSESPMETRIRLAIVLAGLPPPTLQHPVGPFRLDLAYPDVRLGIEYDGRDHRTQERAMRDLNREAYLTRAGWRMLRFRAAEVHNPKRVADRVARMITAR
ncbi:endonuclease domain-containing protein [Pseudonocardia sp. TRM90224]|uniref:endonuclease domain-containing protein n=1 Tax=Pseudonocardia sp. TRM90224 TaxID=2812678 RepID=UPI001E2DAD43|nr:DUF559 domain-containing protein [Pseudonocardia sp. TRM90224]